MTLTLPRSVISLFVIGGVGVACNPILPEVSESSSGSSGPALDGSSSGNSGSPTATDGVATGSVDGTTGTSTSSVGTTETSAGTTDAESTSSDSTGDEPATTTGESAGSSGGAVCGDGMMDPGEACDDGNTDDLDGCLTDCRQGPTGISYGAFNATTQHGNTMGGSVFDDECPTDEVLIGLRGTFGGSVGQMQAICGLLQLVDPGDIDLSLVESTSLPVRGTSIGMAYDATCPAGSAVVGFGGRAGDLIDAIVLRCAPIVLMDDGMVLSLEFGVSGDLPLFGNPAGGNMIPQSDCAAGEVATIANIRAGDSVDAFGITCRPLSLSF